MARVTALLIICCFSFTSFSQPAIKNVRCKADTGQQYALFVPSTYSDTLYHPLIIFLDPAARGDVPVKLYHKLAEERGIILAGSFSSRNFNPQSSYAAFIAVYNDVVNKYRVRSGGVWLSGFSGGARAAANIAMEFSEVSGVIACGAGFADDATVNIRALQNYCAIAGRHDMNYTELLDNSRMLDEEKINNLLLTFSGGHNWPPENVMKQACMWLEEKSGIEQLAGNDLLQFQIGEEDNLYQKWLELDQLVRIEKYRDRGLPLQIALMQAKGFKDDSTQFLEVITTETNYLNSFSLLLNRIHNPAESIDEGEWVRLAEQAFSLANNPKKYIQQSGIRCLDHSYRSVSEYYYQLMEKEAYATALKVAEVLVPFKPQQINPWLLMARAAAMQRKKKLALNYLRKAKDGGNLSISGVKADKALLTIFSPQELEQIADSR